MNLKIEEVLENELRELKNLEIGSDEYLKALNGICKLYELENEKSRYEEELRRAEQRHKETLREQRIDRYIRIGEFACSTFVPLVFYGFWYKIGFKFEEEGTFTSQTFRNLRNWVKPFKK